MNDQELRDLLDELPPMTTGPDFTQRVLTALDVTEGSSSEWRDSSPAPFRTRWLAAAAVIFLLLLAGGWRVSEIQKEQAVEARRAEVEALRQESDRLSRELATLRTRADSAPVVYLGGTEDVDYVIDFARFGSSRSVRTAGL